MLVLIADLAVPDSQVAGVLAGAAALIHAVRLTRWQRVRTLGLPILWILHLGYGWLVVGLALKSAWLLTGAPEAATWLHALTVGCFSTMILAVATRASLGHTGRPLIASPMTVAAYVALTLAAVLRVTGPLLPDYQGALAAAGGLWTVAFLLFLIVYAPILLRPRPDGVPG